MFQNHVFQTFYHLPCKEIRTHMHVYVWQVKNLPLLHMTHSDVFCFIQFIFSNAGYDIKCMLWSFLWPAAWKILFQDVAKQVILERKGRKERERGRVREREWRKDRQTDIVWISTSALNVRCALLQIAGLGQNQHFSGRWSQRKAASFPQNES